MNKTKILKIRPYARLLTMLGEQLIKNERIALIELIKNSYDADADWVKISFVDFGINFEIKEESKIIIEDNGEGMSEETIENHWLNPATPEKLKRKKEKNTTAKGRVIQGEKGIGRFAILKLGKEIKIISKLIDQNNENVINYDFSKYDDDFLTVDGKEKDLFIDNLEVSLLSRKPLLIKKCKITLGTHEVIRDNKGTRIEISDLKGNWSENKVEGVYRDVTRLESIFLEKLNINKCRKKSEAFDVWIYKDDEQQKFKENYLEKLHILLDEKAVIRVEDGVYDENKGEFKFKLNGNPKVLKLRDPELKALRNRIRTGGNILDNRKSGKSECGPFKFEFYIFDFTPQAKAKYLLDQEDKKIIRDHRVYLYRDGIRVYPYGEPDDDWLRIDTHRGVIAAGHFLSNDQVVGHVDISQKDNSRLRDKTNREGLIEEGNATDDFLALLRIFLAYLRHKPYHRYKLGLKNRNAHDIFRTEQVQKEFDEIKSAAQGNRKVLDLVSRAEKEYRTERKYLVQRAETTEDLAGVGISVETASHDIMSIMEKAMASIDSLIKDTMGDDYELDKRELQKEIQTLRGMLSFIESQLKDIQLLFKSSKQSRRYINVKEILEKVDRIYQRLLKKEQIELVIHTSKSPLVAKTTDAVLLQLFLNLFDNSVFWLQQVSKKNKIIEITLDGNKGQMIFSDNGPGVSKEDKPYIFEPFYSGKGEDGRGLGLYIARQLLERNDYSIGLADLKADCILTGANFVVSFISEEK